MKVLFIGGTGTISSAAAHLAASRGIELTAMNRGRSTVRPLPEGVEHLTADVRDTAAVRAAVEGRTFDAVVQFLAFTPDQVAADVQTFAGRTGQYVFISSASAYVKPPVRLPITESTPLRNPFWQYSRDKIACEEVLVRAWREDGFPMTVVRPSHTYDRALLPVEGGWTVVDRMRRGLPVVVHGDGTSLWTLTHSSDVAVGLVGLLGRDDAVGEAFHITGETPMTWDRIHHLLAEAAGVEAKLVHVPSEAIARAMPEWGPGLLGDKSHCLVFDNSKIRAWVPDFCPRVTYRQGAAEQVAWYDAEDSRRVVDPQVEALFDALVARWSQ